MQDLHPRRKRIIDKINDPNYYIMSIKHGFYIDSLYDTALENSKWQLFPSNEINAIIHDVRVYYDHSVYDHPEKNNIIDSHLNNNFDYEILIATDREFLVNFHDDRFSVVKDILHKNTTLIRCILMHKDQFFVELIKGSIVSVDLQTYHDLAHKLNP